MAGPRQHILPRFLLKEFASRIDGDKIFTWVYWRNGKVLEVSIKDVSVEKYFYGKGAEISVDAEITALEDKFAIFLHELRRWPDRTEVTDPKIVDFITHLCLRTKHLRDSFRYPSEFLIDRMREYLSDENNIKALLLKDPKIMEDALNEAIKGNQLPPSLQKKFKPLLPFMASTFLKKNKNIIQFFTQLFFTQLKNSLPSMLKQAHIKALEEGLVPEQRAEKYRSLKWFVSRSQNDLILGDVGCLFDIKGASRYKSLTFADDEVRNIFLPISSNHLLIGTPLHFLPAVDFEAINEAFATYSRDYFVSAESSPKMASLASRIGQEADMISNEELEQILKKTFTKGRG
jgi:hypothetical protein